MRAWLSASGICVLLGALFQGSFAVADGPTEQVKQTAEKMLNIVQDPELSQPEKAEERRKRLREVADERFDWRTMALSSMGPYWRQRTPEEQKEFVGLFRDLIEGSYMTRIESYSGEEIRYTDEKADDKYATVDMTVITRQGTEIPMVYRLLKRGQEWKVYDVSIEGVSLVNNYRQQIRSILSRGSYETLAKTFRDKIEENRAAAEKKPDEK